MKYGQVHDGEWVEPTPQEGHRMKCCDCGLVHTIDFRVVDGRVQFRASRNNRATAAARRTETTCSAGQGPMSRSCGHVILHIDVEVTAEEMASWPAMRITQFMRGMAAVLAAKNGYNHVPGAPLASGSADREPA